MGRLRRESAPFPEPKKMPNPVRRKVEPFDPARLVRAIAHINRNNDVEGWTQEVMDVYKKLTPKDEENADRSAD